MTDDNDEATDPVAVESALDAEDKREVAELIADVAELIAEVAEATAEDADAD